MNKAILTCAVTGVLTDPQRFPVPVTVKEMADECQRAFEEGASIMHLHFRDQRPGMGRMPSWEADVAEEITSAVRSACPGVIINMSTGVMGKDVSGPLACMERIKPEISACNAGTLNYLKTRSNGDWAWPPLVFTNGVNKINTMLEAMNKYGSIPEMECFDLGILRSVSLYIHNGMCVNPHVNFVMGVASGMPVDLELLDILLKYKPQDSHWQVTAIGREEVWAMHQRVAERGGMLRSGLEDSFYLPSGKRAKSNGEMVAALANCATQAGREIATVEEARSLLGLHL
jgi:3-keto-5-aminohexanoate cleavage enzyme